MKRIRNFLSSTTTTSGSKKNSVSNDSVTHVPIPTSIRDSLVFVSTSNRSSTSHSQISTDTPIDIIASPSTENASHQVPIQLFNPVEFQNNLQAFLEQKFDDLEGKRKKDKEEFQSNILKVKKH